MCIAAPAMGGSIWSGWLGAPVSSPAMVRARDWLAEHLDDPGEGLPRDDEELVATRSRSW